MWEAGREKEGWRSGEGGGEKERGKQTEREAGSERDRQKQAERKIEFMFIDWKAMLPIETIRSSTLSPVC